MRVRLLADPALVYQLAPLTIGAHIAVLVGPTHHENQRGTKNS
jgi:hypothetical protein